MPTFLTSLVRHNRLKLSSGECCTVPYKLDRVQFLVALSAVQGIFSWYCSGLESWGSGVTRGWWAFQISKGDFL